MWERKDLMLRLSSVRGGRECRKGSVGEELLSESVLLGRKMVIRKTVKES